jgi:hypothetical protein
MIVGPPQSTAKVHASDQDDSASQEFPSPGSRAPTVFYRRFLHRCRRFVFTVLRLRPKSTDIHCSHRSYVSDCRIVVMRSIPPVGWSRPEGPPETRNISLRPHFTHGLLSGRPARRVQVRPLYETGDKLWILYLLTWVFRIRLAVSIDGEHVRPRSRSASGSIPSVPKLHLFVWSAQYALPIFLQRENPGVDGALRRLPEGSPIPLCLRRA